MKLDLPIKQGSDVRESIDSKCIVVVGSNGSGKTRFGRDIEQRYDQKTHRISAQKSLSMPKEVSPKYKLRAESELFYGNFNENDPSNNFSYKLGYRWGNNPNTFLLDDYEKLMVLLHTEEYEEAIKFKEEYKPKQNSEKPLTKLDKIQIIWEYVLPHRRLKIRAGFIETYPTDTPDRLYNSSEMSDGERVIFYLIGQVVVTPSDSIIIIDEPEMHIHPSITKRLWDKIEQERSDCTFIYLTHDIDFASSRLDSTKIWAKAYNGNNWDYEILDDSKDLPEQLYLEILGSRKPILFIEGDASSIDYKILQLVFDGHTTKPLGSCQKVFESTKSFNEQKLFHNIDSFGLIDRDRRTDEEIANISNEKIWVTGVAEIENFLLLEKVVKTVASKMMENTDHVFSAVKSNVVKFFQDQIERQALDHTIAKVDRIFKCAAYNSSVKKIEELENSLNNFWDTQNFREIYTDFIDDFTNLVELENYYQILSVFNNKGMIAKSNVASLCGLNAKNGAYLNYILSILKQSSEESESIKQAIISKIDKHT